MAFGPASRLGIALFEDTDPIDLWPNRSNEEVETIIRSVYKQVLGNANELPYLKSFFSAIVCVNPDLSKVSQSDR